MTINHARKAAAARTTSSRRSRTRRARLVAAPAALAVATAALAGCSNSADGAPEISPATGGSDAADEATSAGEAVTLTPNPAYRSEEPFEGWGTSLVWFANATGSYPDELREELYDLVFGEDGLNLTIARYNVGGGSASDVDESYFRDGGAVPGWWNPDPAGTGSTEASALANADAYRETWDAHDDASYDLGADEGQRWWVERLAKDGRITRWEAFSNSPPWFMTSNGYASGGDSALDNQLREDSVEDFAAYMVHVVEHLEDTYGISFDTIDPMNEPGTDYWSTIVAPDGSLEGGRQEGAHLDPALQAQLIEALAAELQRPDRTTTAVPSGPDETNPSLFMEDWDGWSDAAREAVGQLNVHTYASGNRVLVRDVSKITGIPLWMSEVEGDFGLWGHDPNDMNNGIGMAQAIIDDLRELEPVAWVFWQPVENRWGSETYDGNWGSIYVDFDCDADGNSARRLADGEADPSCGIVTSTKFDAVRNFTHYIRPGDFRIAVDDPETTAFLDADTDGAVLVHVNPTGEAREVTLDLTRFGTTEGATVTPVLTSQSVPGEAADALVEGEPVPVGADGTATLSIPARSVTTFVVDGVSGIAPDAAPADGVGYVIRSVANDLVLLAAPDGDPAMGEEPEGSWTIETVSGAGTSSRTITLADTQGRLLDSPGDGSVVLLEASSEPPSSAQWMLTTLDGEAWSLLNRATGEQLETDGPSGVTTGASSTVAHQQWTFSPAGS